MWQTQYEHLCQYKQEHGTAHVSVRSTSHPVLGRWCDNQRQAYRRYQKGASSWLNEERIAKLNEIGFQWSLKSNPQVPFTERVQQLADFQRQHNHSKVPLNHPNGLGAWIHRTRTQFRKNELSQERIAELQSANFPLESPLTHATWEERIERLKQFREKHGHTNVPKDYPDDPDLAKWVRRVRQGFRHRQLDKPYAPAATLPDERLGELVMLGFEFETEDTRILTTWEESFQELVKFEKRHGHCRPNKTAEASEYERLNKWVSTQVLQINNKMEGKQCTLSESKIARLRALGIMKKVKRVRGKVLVDGREVDDPSSMGYGDKEDDKSIESISS